MSLFRARTKSAFSPVAPRDIERDDVAIRRADFFLARARGRALQKTIARTFERPSFPRAFSPILDSKCRSKSTGVPLSLSQSRGVFALEPFPRPRDLPRDLPRARADAEMWVSLETIRAFSCASSLCVAFVVAFFFHLERAPNCNEMRKVTRREKKRDDQRHHHHGSNEQLLFFFCLFCLVLVRPRPTVVHFFNPFLDSNGSLFFFHHPLNVSFYPIFFMCSPFFRL